MDDFQTESAAVYKVLLFLKRRPAMSVEAFRYYENTHSKFGEKYSRGLLRYIRRYLDPVSEEELPFDVIKEPPPDVLEDEKGLLDRSNLRLATVVEFDSSLGR
jgi:hypothetical protein